MIQYITKSLKTVLFCFFILSAMNGCRKDYNSVVPDILVNYNFNPINAIELNVPGGSFYIKNIGYGGIIIFRNMPDDPNPFTAYDATCTYEVSSTCHVVDPDGSGVAKCTCCGSEYILFSGSGSPIKGAATQPLKQYHTSFLGGIINIRN